MCKIPNNAVGLFDFYECEAALLESKLENKGLEIGAIQTI